MNIRHANENDIANILDILHANLITQHKDKKPIDLELSGFLIHGFTDHDIKAAITNSEHNMILVANDNDNIIAYALSHDLRKLNPDWIEKDLFYLSHIHLCHQCRREMP